MIVTNAYAGRRVGVLGTGRSGLATAASLQAGGAEPLCWDDGEEGRWRAEEAGFPVEDLTRERIWEDCAALIVSPGIPHLYPAPHPVVQRAWEAGAPVDNDIGLFFRAMQGWEPAADDDGDGSPRIVCITGSNGKSTTTALLRHILAQAGKPVQMGGNIGVPVLALEEPRSDGIVVLELSSYQIEVARRLVPDIAVFLNLSPDHLDRHGGLGGYFAAKQRLFEFGGAQRAVIGIDQPEGRYLADRMRHISERIVRISAERALRDETMSVSLKKAFLVEWARGKQIASFDLREARALPGRHNGQNACAAWAACRLLGLGPRQIESGLRSFPGLTHRLERVGEIDGVVFVNDSKATNADAAQHALRAYESIRWIAGGRAKEGGIAALLPLLERVRKTYLIGEAEADFAATLGDAPHARCGTLEAAVALAASEAEFGDTVLLSPACASFDQFASFEARGEAFHEIVARLAG